MNLLMQRALGILMIATALALVATAFMPVWDTSVREAMQAFTPETPPPVETVAADNPFDDYPDAVQVDAQERDDHLLGPYVSIRRDDPTVFGIDRTLVVWTVVDPAGAVAAAIATDGPRELRPEAQRLVKSQKYVPFTRDAKPVRAQFTSLVSILGRERRPKTRVAFPEIKNWRTLVIGIERQACAGTCPAYKLEIDGNGAVEYEGAKFVALQGKHHADIGQDAVRALYERFKKADYFSLYDNYAGTGDRAQATTLTLGYDGKITRVSEFAGFTQNMPDVVRDLQIAIDRTVGVERWTKGNADTAPSLEVERWNFRSAKNENRAIVAGVAAYGDAQALARLIALGAPVSPNADLHQTLSADDMPVNALDAAILRGDPKILEIILAARAKWTREQFGEALLKAALIGRSDLAMALISAGADPNYTRPNPHPGKGRGAFRGAGHDGRSVLMNAASAGAADLVKVVLDAKPNVNAREEFGWSALHFAAEPDPTQVRDVPAADRVKIVDMLVAAGAKPDAQTDAGDTPIAVCQRYSDVCTTLAKAAKAPPPPPLAAQKTSAKP